MQTVSVSDLKAHLSRYLREVRRGGEVQILDRGRPVARLVGLASQPAADDDHRERLVRAGLLRPGSGSSLAILDAPALEFDAELGRAIDEDRSDPL
jgi:prevent-host-death family protein